MPFASRLALGAVLLAGAAQAPDSEVARTPTRPQAGERRVEALETLDRELAALLREQRGARLRALPLAGRAGDERAAILPYRRRLEDLARQGSAAAAVWIRLGDLAAAGASSLASPSGARVDAWSEILREALREPRLWEGGTGLLRALEAEEAQVAGELQRRLDAGALGDRSTLAARLARAALHARLERASGAAPREARAALAELLEPSHETGALARCASELAWRLEHLETGREAPALVTYDVDGNEIRTADLRGRIVVIDFWSFDEPRLVENMASRRRLAALARANGIELIGIGLEPDAQTHRRVADELELDWTTSWEGGPEGPAASAWRIREAPASVVLDVAGRIRFVGVPGARLEQAVEQLSSEAHPAGVRKDPQPDGRRSEEYRR
jgi:peroxiredoxin